MALTPSPILAKLKTYAQRGGLFTSVLTHEPKSAPPVNSITYAMWVMSYAPVATSGTQSVSMRLVVMGRIYVSALTKPMDNIDGNLHALAAATYDSYCGNFTLDGLVRQVDIFGQHGVALAVQYGHASQDEKLFRMADITIPLILNDQHDEVN